MPLPRALPPTSSPELLAAVSLLREEFPDTWMQTHLSENPNEVAWVSDLWPEHERYLDVYHHYGLTGERSVFAHAIHLHHSEWQCLHDTGSAVAFLPPPLNLFSRQRAVFACPPAGSTGCDGHRHRRRCGHHLSACLRTLGEAYKVGQLQSYRLRASEAFYHCHAWAVAHALRLDDKIWQFSRPAKRRISLVIDPDVTPLAAPAQSSLSGYLRAAFRADDLGRRAQHQRDLGQRRAGVVNCRGRLTNPPGAITNGRWKCSSADSPVTNSICAQG